ncbi:MAG: hypothetical protein HOO06_03035 [Bdellovibrionaceae bacterium]|nr:hypothetical protein [Pseudobdellovibrionaceae bacterium]
MSLASDLKNKRFDKRLVDWNLKNNVITQAEYDQMMSSLSDETDNATTVELSNMEEHAVVENNDIEVVSNDGGFLQ